jgi:hypothetical protein
MPMLWHIPNRPLTLRFDLGTAQPDVTQLRVGKLNKITELAKDAPHLLQPRPNAVAFLACAGQFCRNLGHFYSPYGDVCLMACSSC